MRRVRRQTQRVNSLPRSDADLRRIEIGALLGELLASLFGALKFFVSEAFGCGDRFAAAAESFKGGSRF